MVMFDQVCKCLFSDGLVDCEDPECCENPVCERSQLCHTVSAPIGEFSNDDDTVVNDDNKDEDACEVDVDGNGIREICHTDFEWRGSRRKH